MTSRRVGVHTRRGAYTALVVLTLIWGSNWIVMKEALAHAHPVVINIQRTWIAIVVLFGVLANGEPGAAQIYKWVDASGTVHFSDTPPKPAADAGAGEVLPETQHRPAAPPPRAFISAADADACAVRRAPHSAARRDRAACRANGGVLSCCMQTGRNWLD